MRALIRLSDTPGDFQLGEIEEPDIEPGMVKIKVAYCGICGSDLHIYQGFEPGLPQGVHGHEFSGTIAEIDESLQGRMPGGLKVGDRVTVEHTYSTCGVCEYCKSGRYHLCEKRRSVGFDIQGAFTDYVVVDPQYLHRVPDSVSLKDAALTEPLACIMHGLAKLPLEVTERVLVIGPGPMGILSGLVLMATGHPVDIAGAPADTERLAVAAGCGMTVIREPEEKAYRAVVDCSGAEGGIRNAIKALKKGGTLLQVAIATRDIALPYDQMVYKELSIEGTYCHTWRDWEAALALQGAGLLDLTPVRSAVISLEDWKAGFDAMEQKKGLKYLIEFSGED